MRVALAQINPCVGDLEGNVARCLAAIETARRQDAVLVVLPEMAIPGYPPRDILFDPSFVGAVGEATHDLARRASSGPPTLVGGLMPADRQPPHHPGLYNAALLLEKGEVRLAAAKRLLPAYDVFYEPRWFVPGPAPAPITIAGKRVGVLVCEDMWDEGYHLHPGADLLASGAELLVCLSASPYHPQVMQDRLYHARRQGCSLVYVNLCGANDELIFDGRSFGINQRGEMIAQLAGFEEAVQVVDLENETFRLNGTVPHLSETSPHACGIFPHLGGTSLHLRGASPHLGVTLPYLSRTSPHLDETLPRPSENSPVQSGDEDSDPNRELFQALVLGVRDFAAKNRLDRAFLGLSGGVDSALVACIAAEALGPDRVTAVAIPSRYTDPRSTACARQLAQALSIGFEVVELEQVHAAAEATLGELLDGGTTAENVQARLRAMILMSFVNRYGGMLLNASNKTELALGYATLYGDMAGGLCPIGDLTKPQVLALARWIDSARGVIPSFILERPPSAELRPDQVDPLDYPQVAPAMERLVQADRSDFRLRRSEHKRWQMGVILKVSRKSFGTGRLMPITRR
jgi:NAD+ synthase (glutamine-hydrolysing)